MRRKERTIVVIGGGGHAKVLIGVLRKLPWDIAGYTDSRDVGVLLGAPCLGDDSVLPDVIAANANCAAIIGLGKVDASSRRAALQGQIESLGYEFPVIVSPAAVVNVGVELGPGTVVFDGAVINPGATAGDHQAARNAVASWSRGKQITLVRNPLWPDKLGKFGDVGLVSDKMKKFMKPEQLKAYEQIFIRHNIQTI